MVKLTKRSILRWFGAGLGLSAFAGATAGDEHADDGTGAGANEGDGGDESDDGGDDSDGTSPVETVVDVPGDPVPENLAIDPDGTLYFGITAGEVWEVTNAQTQMTDLTPADLTRVAELPGSVVGVEVVPGGSIYVASSTDDDDTGVWVVPRDGHRPYSLASISGFPNDVVYDPDFERLLVTESFGGAVYEVSLTEDDPSAELWFEDATLETESFGANGLTFARDGSVLVAVTRAVDEEGTDVGRLVRVPVREDGRAGAAETYLESPEIFGADGVTTEGPDAYVAANSQNRVVRVTPEKHVEVVADGDDGLVFPSDVLFGVTPRQRSDLFICNFANQSPEDGAILRAHPFADGGDDGDGSDGAEASNGDGGESEDEERTKTETERENEPETENGTETKDEIETENA